MAFENEKTAPGILTSDEQESLAKLLKHPEVIKQIKEIEKEDNK